LQNKANQWRQKARQSHLPKASYKKPSLPCCFPRVRQESIQHHSRDRCESSVDDRRVDEDERCHAILTSPFPSVNNVIQNNDERTSLLPGSPKAKLGCIHVVVDGLTLAVENKTTSPCVDLQNKANSAAAKAEQYSPSAGRSPQEKPSLPFPGP
jgi:hypothetical protein